MNLGDVFIPAKDPGDYVTNEKLRAKAQGRVEPEPSASDVGTAIKGLVFRGSPTVRSASTINPSVTAKRIASVGGLGEMIVPRYPSTPVCGQSAPDGPPDMWPSGNNNFYLQRSVMPYGRQLRGLSGGGHHGGGGGHHGGGGGHGGGGHHGGGGGGRHHGGGGWGRGGGWGYPYGWDAPYTGFIETVVQDCGPDCIWDGYTCICPEGKNAPAGLGLVPDTQAYADSWAGGDTASTDAAQADDVAGNGIFDGPGAPPTAHAGTGVFASHYALPGYIYREKPTRPSEIRDTTTGMPVVFEPGPSNWHADMVETYRPFDLEVPRLYAQKPVFPQGSVKGLGEVSFTDTAKAYLPYLVVGAGLGLVLSLVMKFVRGQASESWEY